jgi:hypothetical protein
LRSTRRAPTSHGNPERGRRLGCPVDPPTHRPATQQEAMS